MQKALRDEFRFSFALPWSFPFKVAVAWLKPRARVQVGMGAGWTQCKYMWMQHLQGVYRRDGRILHLWSQHSDVTLLPWWQEKLAVRYMFIPKKLPPNTATIFLSTCSGSPYCRRLPTAIICASESFVQGTLGACVNYTRSSPAWSEFFRGRHWYSSGCVESMGQVRSETSPGLFGKLCWTFFWVLANRDALCVKNALHSWLGGGLMAHKWEQCPEDEIVFLPQGWMYPNDWWAATA